MFKLFKKNEKKDQSDDNLAIKLAALLIHVARIDEKGNCR